jgi:hypothetical protein
MYGRVEIELDGALHGMTIPSACLIGDVSHGQGKVFIVNSAQASLRQVEIGQDTGIEVEILSGISPADTVVIRPPGGLADGVQVVGMAAKSAAAKSH